MFNHDTPNLPLILPEKEIDLTQTSDYRFGGHPQVHSPSPQEVRAALIELLDGLQNGVAKTFELEDQKIKELADNTNGALNDLDRRIEGSNQMIADTETVLHSFLLLNLLGDQMQEDARLQHENVIARFLTSKAISHATEHFANTAN